MNKFSIRTYHDLAVDGLRVQLRCDSRYVEGIISTEALADAYSPAVLMQVKLEELAAAWTAQHGGSGLKVWPPAGEGKSWTVGPDDVIDGEIVEERRAIDASRRSIEGR